MSMELVMNNEELTCKIFSRLTELRDILRAEEVSREWHALMQDDRVWEPLCRRHAGKGLATGFGMLASLKSQPECRLSWRQLFVQRARALKRPPKPKAPTGSAKPQSRAAGKAGARAPRRGQNARRSRPRRRLRSK